MTVNLPGLTPVPVGVVTKIKPESDAPAEVLGTIALICVSESTWKLVAGVPLTVTSVAPAKWLPLMVTSVPTGPLLGRNEVIVGGTVTGFVTVKVLPLTPVPTAVLTLRGPWVAPLGTVARICVS